MGKVEMPRCADARGGVRSLPTDGSPNIGGYSNCGGLSQALTARSECYAALVLSLLHLDATWWRHVLGTKPNGRERMGWYPGGAPYTHFFILHTVI